MVSMPIRWDLSAVELRYQARKENFADTENGQNFWYSYL
jgi:hypothetical protein